MILYDIVVCMHSREHSESSLSYKDIVGGAGCQCWPRRGEVTFLKRSERTLNSASIFNITNSYISKCRRFNRIYPLRMFNRRYGSKSRPRPATCVPAKGWHDFHFLPFLYYSKGWSIMLPLSWQQQGAEGSRDKEFIVD